MKIIMETTTETTMETPIDKGCGLEIWKTKVTACVYSEDHPKEIRTFGTTTDELEKLKQWIKETGTIHVAIENTVPYWKPVYNILKDEQWEILLVDVRYFKNVPARKNGNFNKDCEWLCALLRTGILEGRFIPPENIQPLRSFTQIQKATRDRIIAEQNRILKLLEECNIKITRILSDVFGAAGMKILTDLSQGITLAETLAKYPEEENSLLCRKEQAVACLKGRFGSHDQFLLKTMSDSLNFYQQQLEVINREVKKIKSGPSPS